MSDNTPSESDLRRRLEELFQEHKALGEQARKALIEAGYDDPVLSPAEPKRNVPRLVWTNPDQDPTKKG